jgi:peptidoglycan/xylan/chitin deacetylase (PgdA/CDA1 family)
MRVHSRFACLTYHLIGDGSNQYVISESQLRSQLALLKAAQYAVDDFEQFETRLRLGLKVPLPYVVITVDDGHETSLQAADLLERYGFRATFFLTRERCLKKMGFIRGPDIRALRARGFSAGTHGTTHRALTFLPREQCVAELAESKRWLEDVIGEEVRYMAVPGGFINARVMKSACEFGYTLVGTCNEWMNSPETMVLPCKVNRVNVRRHFSAATFLRIIQGEMGFYMSRQVRAAALALPKQLAVASRRFRTNDVQ